MNVAKLGTSAVVMILPNLKQLHGFYYLEREKEREREIQDSE